MVTTFFSQKFPSKVGGDMIFHFQSKKMTLKFKPQSIKFQSFFYIVSPVQAASVATAQFKIKYIKY